VLARLDGDPPGPLGHALDGSHAARAHEHPHAALDLLEALGDGLRPGGRLVLVDHGAAGEVALVPAALREKGARLLRGRLRSLRHDQLRGDEKTGEIEEIEVDMAVELLASDGAVLLRRDLRLTERAPSLTRPDMIHALGLRLGAELLRDPAFLAAIGGR
jgi:SAM-dependent methyltransferase